MSRRARNAIEFDQPWEVREAAYEAIFAGKPAHEVEAAVFAACGALKIEPPNAVTSRAVAAVRERSDEYRRWADQKRRYTERMEKRRWAAGLIRQGRGPSTLADLAEMEILEQLHGLAAGGLLETGKDVATVARAIATMKRTQLAEAQANHRAEIDRIENEHAERLAAKDAEIETLRQQLEAATGSREVDPAKVAANLDRLLGAR